MTDIVLVMFYIFLISFFFLKIKKLKMLSNKLEVLTEEERACDRFSLNAKEKIKIKKEKISIAEKIKKAKKIKIAKGLRCLLLVVLVSCCLILMYYYLFCLYCLSTSFNFVLLGYAIFWLVAMLVTTFVFAELEEIYDDVCI